jgi:hypothetical protein
MFRASYLTLLQDLTVFKLVRCLGLGRVDGR